MSTVLASLECSFSKLFGEVECHGLALVRILYGALMVIDTMNERGFNSLEQRWGSHDVCRFPMLHFIQPPSYETIHCLYVAMVIGATGIMFGAMFKLSCLLYTTLYWYVLTLDKSYWNNHSYLFGLLGILFSFTNANYVWSVDSYFWPKKETVPFIQYFVLRFQVFLVYFYAGLKKLNSEWLGGHSMYYLSQHWVFRPFRMFLPNWCIDLILVHWGGFLIDISAGFLLCFKRTKPIAFLFCSLFNLMNSRMFSIGMFPYAMLALMLIFNEPNWVNFHSCSNEGRINNRKRLTKQQRFTCFSLLFYITLQLFVPYSHFITRGYNTWTDGDYGYSWDMMVHNWRILHTKVTIVDKIKGHLFYVDPRKWTPNQRWTHHADMVKTFAEFSARILTQRYNLTNIEVYIDVWISLNGRFFQRVYDPTVDILKAKWSPFKDTKWVLPLLRELEIQRPEIKLIEEELYMSNNGTYVIFLADIPGMKSTNFIPEHVEEVQLELLAGQVSVDMDKGFHHLTKGQKLKLERGQYHTVTTWGRTPSCYSYRVTSNNRIW